jgi:putative oxygen-independent coproporphyrinogen III oxidase
VRYDGAGLYVHVPFCSAICPYCDFAVLTGGAEKRAGYVGDLLAEIAMYGGGGWSEDGGGAIDLGASMVFDTVYLGGGTPSALAPEELARILGALRAALPVRADAWVFCEANPEDASADRVRAWRAAGVDTLSLGIQSFDTAALRFLGRRHDPGQARRSVELARQAGFRTVSIDLIYGLPAGLPGATLASWRRDLEAAVEAAPDHLSCYQLTIHAGTPFGFRAGRGEIHELPEPAQAELFRFTHEFLADRGYLGYEVSSFARAPEHQSRHNRKYWDHTPYLGLGPSAHSFSGRRRWWNERKLRAWSAKIAAGGKPVAGGEELGGQELALEALMLGLRTRAGVDLARFRERYGIDLAARNDALIDRLATEGLLEPVAGALIPSVQGLSVADSLARAFELGDG